MMTKYAVFLRGVNVGGVNLKMAEVATALTDAGFSAVRTILASGNVLLESSAKAATVRKKTEATLRETFGYDAWVLAYDVDAVRTIVDAYPFEPEVDGYQSYVTFVASPVGPRSSMSSQRWPSRPAPTRRSAAGTASSIGRYPKAARWTARSARRWASLGTSRRPRRATCAPWPNCCGDAQAKAG